MTRFDNYMVDVIGERREQFELAMKLAFAGRQGATHWAKTKAGALLFFWAPPDKDSKFAWIEEFGSLPATMNAEVATVFAWDWLQKAPINEPEPDHDGDNHRGWRVSTTDDVDMSGNDDKYSEERGSHSIWCKPCGIFTGLVAIKPCFAMYGK